MSNADLSLLKQLAENSSRYRDPLTAIDWGGIDGDGFWLPEAALSLYGLPEYEALAAETSRRLSQYEFINVMCCGLWLESVFVRRLSHRLGLHLARAEHEYFLHEVREEAGHSLMFLKAIAASGLQLPPAAWRAPRLADILARHAPAASALFWLATVIAEDIPDKFNRYVRNSLETVNPVVRQICSLHAMDEARHIAAARSRLERALESVPAWRRRLLTPVMNLLLRQFVDTFYVPPAKFYELAGLTHGGHWRGLARANPVHREFVRQLLAPTLRMLEAYGLKPAP
ncbi:MAG: diiron oxygenase [Burkholderiales bacterium]